jgi:diaminohydroxyphosphoribosylaminopyrimidine deaminase/5-amino-6-(5-phosphoribosylamino)uracil reductase
MNWSALKSGIVCKVQTYISPKLFGGKTAASPVAGKGVPTPDDAFRLEKSTVKQIGNDFLIESMVQNVYGHN